MFRENDCGFLIKHINDVLQRDSNNALRGRDLTMAQVTVLLHLDSVPGRELPLKELERRLQVAQSTAAGIISRLEQKGFVEGFGSQEDKRIKMVRITRAGLDCCEMAHTEIRDTEERLLAKLTESERLQFTALLKKVSDSLK